ncbi:BQ2448_7685 [Microbotryum intermedium]|uniref:BQ2448_7685 protein n=1 Tax=Microbotryum intermedium TaxID=269621 RepID=A0A238FUB1_9BASI|nr:BQ2448_7685 [Microbotryum intermedium]
MSTSDPIPIATTTEATLDSNDPPQPHASTSQQPIPAPAPAPAPAPEAASSAPAAPAAPAARPTIAAHPLVSSLIPLEAHLYALLRVTLHGQMSKQIQFAHSQLLSNKPIVLHAMPPSPTATTASTSAPIVSSTPAKAALPRLISTCEILKRTFTTRLLELKYSSSEIKAQLGVQEWIKGCKGLHQYTLLTTMQDVALVGTTKPGQAQQGDQVEGTGGDDDVVRDWLLGSRKKNSRPKTKQHASPLLVIFLSPYPIDALANDRAFSYQEPDKLPRLKRTKPVETPIHEDPPLASPLEEVEMEDGEIADEPSSIVEDAETASKKKVKVRPNRKKKRMLQEAAAALKAAKVLRATLLKAGKPVEVQKDGKQAKQAGNQVHKDPKQVKKKRTRRSRGKPKVDTAAEQ